MKTTIECPHPDCDKRVNSSMVACNPHYLKLTYDERKRILKAMIDDGPMAAYEVARTCWGTE